MAKRSSTRLEKTSPSAAVSKRSLSDMNPSKAFAKGIVKLGSNIYLEVI